MQAKKRYGFALILYWLISTPCLASITHVVVVLSDNTRTSQTFASRYLAGLPPQINASVIHGADNLDLADTDLIVTVGPIASQNIFSQTGLPVLATMISSQSYSTLLKLRPKGSQTTAIYLDQPSIRQIHFLQATLPKLHQVGLLYANEAAITPLKNTFNNNGYSVHSLPVENESRLFDSLTSVLKSSDLLYATPDADVYNNRTIANILLSSYRLGVPIVGYSENFVKAGAVCGLYSTPEQMAGQADLLSINFSKNKTFPSASYPAEYSISINRDVARSLGIVFSSIEEIRRKVEKDESK